MKMKKKMLSIIISLVVLLSSASLVYASSSVGSSNTNQDREYTLEEMLQYALEDEYMAYEEYKALMAEFGEQRPFSNIIKAELYHIELVEGLYESYDMLIPDFDASEYVVIPDSIEEAIEIGVQAEINNIAMYDKFLAQELPDDVREAFELLKEASVNHLAAFEQDRGGFNGARNTDKTNGTNGNGFRGGNNASNQKTPQGTNGGNGLNIEDCLYQ
jgi:hypothetical protein